MSFAHLDEKNNTPNIHSILDEFLNHVFQSKLPKETKEDVTSVISTLNYIKNNPGFISEAANEWNKHAPFSSSKVKKYFKYERDYKNGIIRDSEDGPGIHVNGYNSGKEASETLNYYVRQIEEILQKLTPSQQLNFATKLQFDPEMRCLDARTVFAIKWAENVLSGCPSLDYIMAECQAAYEEKSFGESRLTFFTRFCEEQGYVRCLDNNIKKEITEKLIKDYLKNILGWSEAEEQKEIKEEKEFFKIPPHHIRIGLKGMVQYHFIDKKSADNFLGKLKLVPVLKKLNIEKANVQQVNCDACKNTCFVFRLTEQQIDACLGQGGYLKLIEIKNINNTVTNKETCLPLINAIKDFDHTLTNVSAVLLEDNNWCVLQTIARDQSPEAFMRFIDKLDADTCKTAALLKDNDNWGTLQTIARYQSPEAFMRFIDKLDADTCKTAALLKNNDNWSTLQTITRFQSPEAFMRFIDKLDADTCKFILREGHNKNFIDIINYSSPENVAILFDTMKKSNQPLTDYDYFNPEYWYELWYFWLKGAIFFQPAENIIKFLEVINKDSHLDWLLRHFKKTIHADHERIILSILCYKLSQLPRFANNLDEKQEESFHPNTKINAWINNILDLQQEYRMQHPLPIPCSEEKISLQEEKILKTFETGNALIKVIDTSWTQRSDLPDPLDDLVHQLKDLSYRPVIRGKLKDKKMTSGQKTGFKLVLMKDEIIKTRTEEESLLHKKNKHRTHTKKLASTLISKELYTLPFGYTNPNREMVCVMFNADQTLPDSERLKFKALLIRDLGTFHREWIQEDRDSVYNYQRIVRQFYSKDYNEFQARINKVPGVTNEILAQIPPAAKPTITIGRDTKKARQLAQQAKLKLETECKYDNITIAFYNPEYQSCRIYSETEQALDKLEEAIHANKLPSLLISLFSKKPEPLEIEINQKILSVPIDGTPEAKLILDIIQRAKTGKVILENAWVNIVKKLVPQKNNIAPQPRK